MIPLKDDNPSRTRPYVTWTLIAINIVVFLFQLAMDAAGNLDQIVYAAGVIPAEILARPLSPELLTLFSSMFLHGGWIHLLGNMLYLWIFGDNIEDRMGHVRFLIFYLLGGVAAALTQIAFSNDSFIPMIGASGAIAAVLGAYLLEYPRARVRSLLFLGYFVRFVNVPALIVLGMWFVIQFFNSFLSLSASYSTGGGVAYLAHVGGFVAGLLLVKLFTIGRPKTHYWELKDLGRRN